jgi:HTH-type transcriptional regulator / antitoxin HipB
MDMMEQKHNTWRIESPKALGSALRALREERGLTQADIARSLGTTRQRLSRIEDGEVSAQVLLILRAIRLLQGELLLERDSG